MENVANRGMEEVVQPLTKQCGGGGKRRERALQPAEVAGRLDDDVSAKGETLLVDDDSAPGLPASRLCLNA